MNGNGNIADDDLYSKSRNFYLQFFDYLKSEKDMSKFGNGRGTITKFIQMPKIQ